MCVQASTTAKLHLTLTVQCVVAFGRCSYPDFKPYQAQRVLPMVCTAVLAKSVKHLLSYGITAFVLVLDKPSMVV